MEKKKNIVLILLFIIIAVMACFGVKMSKEIFELKQSNQNIKQNNNQGQQENNSNQQDNNSQQSISDNSNNSDSSNINDPNAVIIENVDYNVNIGGFNYFSKELIISNNKLYVVLEDNNEYTKAFLSKTINLNNKKAYYLMANVKNAYIYPYGNGGAYLTYALTNDGNLYYIHNINYNMDKYNTLELYKIDDLNNISTVETITSDASEIVAIDNAGNKFLLEYDNYKTTEKIN